MDLLISDIQACIPHRYPFLLVDRIIAVEETRVSGIKAVTINEPYFQGHFPEFPVMPGVLIIEAMAQVGAVGVMRGADRGGRLPYLVGVDKTRFRRQVVPGDVLRLDVTLDRFRGRAGKGHGVATVEGELAAEGDFMFVLGDGPGAST
ncbi:MAG: 3-hydroxyacyl-ACP dehydratase FabZ [Chloroflexota bacterium]